MKILLMITGLGMGGAENQICHLADEYVKNGHEVQLISLTGPVKVRPRNNKIKIISFEMNKNIFCFFNIYKKVREQIIFFSPDVVHSHMVHANLFARLLRFFCPMPKLICTAHSANEGGAIRMFCYRITNWLCDIFSNVSQDAVNAFESSGAAKKGSMYAIYNGIDTEYFAFNYDDRLLIRSQLLIEERVPLLLAVGSLNEAKDYPNLLKAFFLLENKECKLAIVGEGPLKNDLQSLVKSLSLESRVFFLGLRRDVVSLMSAADIFVLSSAWEGLPCVLGEALSCECLTISTDAGGSREWFSSEYSSFVVPVHNSNALAQKIEYAMKMDESEISLFKKVGRKYIENNFSLSSVALQWVMLYKK